MSVQAVQAATGIAGTLAYMCPELLDLVHRVKNNVLGEEPEVDAALLIASDTFGVGCVIAYICSRGRHPFQTGKSNSIPSNIRAHRRVKLEKLKIVDPLHVELVSRFTTWMEDGWTVTEALGRSKIFDHGRSSENPEILLDKIAMLKRPPGSCEDQLLAAELVERYSWLPKTVELIRADVQRKMELGVSQLDIDS